MELLASSCARDCHDGAAIDFTCIKYSGTSPDGPVITRENLVAALTALTSLPVGAPGEGDVVGVGFRRGPSVARPSKNARAIRMRTMTMSTGELRNRFSELSACADLMI